jgi:excisionase family DNA binding protein
VFLYLDPYEMALYSTSVEKSKHIHLPRGEIMKDALRRPLTVREVADALGLSVHTIRAWISQGRLTHVRLGRAIRVLPSEVDAMLRNCTVEAALGSTPAQKSGAVDRGSNSR